MADVVGENREVSQKRGKKGRSQEEQALHTQRIETTELIADQLGETEEEPRRLIYRIVKHLGVDPSLAFLQRTHEIEAAGGLMLPDGSRRRTIGGVYFYLVRHETAPEISRLIFPPAYKRRRQQEKAQGDQPQAAPGQQVFLNLLQQRGLSGRIGLACWLRSPSKKEER
jgi:hypothetical protein